MYSAVRTGPLNKTVCTLSLNGSVVTKVNSFVENDAMYFGMVHISALNIQVACCSETLVSFYNNMQC